MARIPRTDREEFATEFSEIAERAERLWRLNYATFDDIFNDVLAGRRDITDATDSYRRIASDNEFDIYQYEAEPSARGDEFEPGG